MSIIRPFLQFWGLDRLSLPASSVRSGKSIPTFLSMSTPTTLLVSPPPVCSLLPPPVLMSSTSLLTVRASEVLL